MIEQKNGQQVFEYKFPDFLTENNGEDSANSNDYEILQVLGSGSFSCVLKVKSKINNQIYAMKKIDIDKIVNEKNLNKKYFENEICILQKLKSPYVCKCYNIFQEGKFLFFIMEFMNNSDLNTFYEANKALGKQIPEDQLWNIFYKCISGLKYIHEKGLIHRDIKLENLFLDDDFNIKIGDFNVSATVDQRSAENFGDDQEELDNLVSGMTVVGTKGYIAPEVKRNERMKSTYGTKADVYSMGVSFFELCYGCKPYEKGKNEDFYNKNLYSKELNHVVDLMIERNDRKRPYSEDVYDYIRKYFIKKYVKNSSVDAALHCFFCYENFKSFFNDNKNRSIIHQLNGDENQEMDDEQINHKIEIGNSVFDTIQSLNLDNKDKIEDYLYELRKDMTNAGLNAKDNEEIEPGILISFFLRILNSVINEITVVDEKSFNLQGLIMMSSSFTFQAGKEEEIFNQYIRTYNQKLNSLISRNFFNMIKIRRECAVCHLVEYSFSMLHFIPFNVKILTKKSNKTDNWNIKDGFKYLLNDNITLSKTKGIFCGRCKDYTNHNESKHFYHTAKNLIIIFDREENFSNKEFINFDELLTLDKTEAERYFEVKYRLVAVLQKKENSKENGEYESFMNSGNNKWISNQNKQKVISLDEVKKNGITFALFYYSDDNNLILQANNNQGNNFSNNNIPNNNFQGMSNYYPGNGMSYPNNNNNNNVGFNYNYYNNTGMNNLNRGQNNIGNNNMNSGMNNYNIGTNDMNRRPNNTNIGMNNYNTFQNDMNSGMNNYNRGSNNMNSEMNNIYEGGNNLNRGPNQINRRTNTMYEGGNNFNRRPNDMNNYNRGPSDMNRGPNNMNSGMNNLNRGQNDMNNGMNNYNTGSNNINSGMNNYNTGTNNMNSGMNNMNGGVNNNNMNPLLRMKSNNFNNYQMNNFRKNNI